MFLTAYRLLVFEDKAV